MPLKPDEKLIANLAKLLRKNDLEELEYQVGNERIKVAARRFSDVGIVAEKAETVAEAPSPAPAEGDEVIVNSPMVGMAYLASQPGTPTYVKKGDKVRKGKTLLIIEAMKTMNPVAAPIAGIVKKVIVEDGTPVEYGQPLVALKPG